MTSSFDFSCYLVISGKFHANGTPNTWKTPSVKAFMKKPSVGPNEIVMELSMSVPHALFKRPQLRAKIAVPPEQTPFVIDCDMQHRIAEQLRETLGCDLSISVAVPGEETES